MGKKSESYVMDKKELRKLIRKIAREVFRGETIHTERPRCHNNFVPSWDVAYPTGMRTSDGGP